MYFILVGKITVLWLALLSVEFCLLESGAL